MNLPFHLKYYFYYLVAEYEGAPTVIKITVLFAILLVLVFILSISHIIVLNLRFIRQKRTKDQFISLYGAKVNKILSSTERLKKIAIIDLLGNSNSVDVNKNKKLYTDGLIEIIRELKSSGIKIHSEHLMIVLNYFHLPIYWQSAFLKGRLSKRKQALRKMDQLEQLLSGSLLLHSVYHRNNDFRKQSRSAFIEYDTNDPYKFFEEDFDIEFNALDEIRLHHYLKRKAKLYKLPDFSRWVENAKNNNFKRFIIKEIGLLRQYHCANLLMNLLQKEKDLYVQKQIIETLGTLDYKESASVLIAMYSSSLTLLQKAIITTLAKLKTEKTLAFLGDTYQRSYDSSIKIQLAYALTDYGIEGQLKMESLSQFNNNFDSKILAQVKFANSQKKRQTTATI